MVVFRHQANHPWKRIASQARSCRLSPLPTAIVFTNKKEGICANKQIDIHIMLGHLTLKSNVCICMYNFAKITKTIKY